MKRPLYLIHGRLGAGKTSLITHLAGTEAFARAFIIENEFASENVDAHTLEEHVHRENIVEINGGCICCSSGAELLDALTTIAARTDATQPTIVETTGVASAAQLLKQLFLSDVFHAHFTLAKNVLILDASELAPATIGAWQLDIALADLVVLNKQDLVDPLHFAALERALTTICSDARCIPTNHGAIAPSLLADGRPSGAEQYLIEHISDIAEALNVNHAQNVQYRVIRQRTPTTAEAIRRHLEDVRTGGARIYRLKGHFRDPADTTWHIESTEKHVAVTPAHAARPCTLVVIGEHLPDTLFAFLA
ncbi:MAG: GTP-binding protein [bacterium]|nr:GTP-binding protein [bacterium]